MEEKSTTIFLDKISNLLSITPIVENNYLALTIFTISSLSVAVLMVLLTMNKKIKHPLYSVLIVIVFYIIFVFYHANNNDKMNQITVKNGFYQNIKNQNIVIQDYFTVEERVIIKFCLEKNEKETDFKSCLKEVIKKVIEEKQKTEDYLKAKENNQEIINQFNIE